MSALVEAQGLTVGFGVRRGLWGARRTLVAVSDVSLAIEEGRTLGIVGESGCGKSTLGRALLGLVKSQAGTVRVAGQSLGALGPGELRALRRQMQLIFQDPYSSLNPRMTVAASVQEPLDLHRGEVPAAGRRELALALLERVGLSREQGQRRPAGLSGGQRQRVVIARALAVEPRFVVADEPVSALDVSVQASILNLLDDVRRERRLTMAFISHDLKVVRHVSDEVAVMYLGRLVERATVEALFAGAAHPYSLALLSAVPAPGRPRGARVVLSGELPSALSPPTGCAFHTRCPRLAGLSPEQRGRCTAERPSLRPASHGGVAACHFPER